MPERGSSADLTETARRGILLYKRKFRFRNIRNTDDGYIVVQGGHEAMPERGGSYRDLYERPFIAWKDRVS
jgi:hypothetical protein